MALSLNILFMREYFLEMVRASLRADDRAVLP